MAAHGTLTSYTHGCHCPDCRKTGSDYSRTLREQRVAEGLCTRCGHPVPPDSYVMCFTCRQRQSDAMRRYRARWAERG